jgi:hypothetical protein
MSAVLKEAADSGPPGEPAVRTIWKFPIDFRGWTPVRLAPNSKVVLAALDPATGGPAIWLEHETSDVLEVDAGIATAAEVSKAERMIHIRYFTIYGTGHDIEPGAKHVGSMIDRDYVWHIYERMV